MDTETVLRQAQADAPHDPVLMTQLRIISGLRPSVNRFPVTQFSTGAAGSRELDGGCVIWLFFSIRPRPALCATDDLRGRVWRHFAQVPRALDIAVSIPPVPVRTVPANYFRFDPAATNSSRLGSLRGFPNFMPLVLHEGCFALGKRGPGGGDGFKVKACVCDQVQDLVSASVARR